MIQNLCVLRENTGEVNSSKTYVTNDETSR
jgi:hypothetical protein